MKAKNTLLKIAWIVAFFISGSIVFYLEVFGFYAPEGDSIAMLKQSNGKIQYRSNGFSSWYNAINMQSFYEGDRVSTNKGSSALIVFSTGQQLKLQENSQIEIEKFSEEDKDIKITLLKGYVSALGAKSAALTLKAKGGKEYRIDDASDEVCLSKNFTDKGNVECLKQDNQIKVEKKPMVKMASLSPQIILEEIKVPEILAPEIIDIPDPKDYLPTFTPKLSNKEVIWFIGKPDLNMLKIEFQVTPPKDKPYVGEWIPFLDINNVLYNKKDKTIFGAKFKNQSIQVQGLDLKRFSMLKPQFFLPSYEIAIEPGVKIIDRISKQERSTKRKEKYTYMIRSLSDIHGENIELTLENTEIIENLEPWFTQKKILNDIPSNIKITLADSKDLFHLVPFMKSGNFNLQSRKVYKSANIFVARDKEIIASIKGKISENDAKRIRKHLKADFIFEGKVASFFQSKNKSPEQFKQWLDGLKNKSRVVFALKGNRFFPVSKEFLLRGQVAEFVGSRSTYVFDKKVKILDQMGK